MIRHSLSRSPRASRGIALLIVITVLVVLVMIAVPFVITMRHGQENTEALAARERADFEASMLLETVKQMLARTHPAAELARLNAVRASPAAAGAGAAARGRDVPTDTDPEVDTAAEFDPATQEFRALLDGAWRRAWDADPLLAQRAKALKDSQIGPSRDDRGSIWSAAAVDAQACLHVNGASPFLLGNLMGAALLTEELDGGATEIRVENVVTARIPGFEGFPRKNGAVRIGREVITYQVFDGGAFKGCSRGAFTDAPLGLNGGAETHKAGTAVISYDAFQLAMHMIASKPGRLSPFENLAALRRISEWGPGLSAERLRALEPYLTVWARRETAEWLASQMVVNQLGQSGEGAAQDQVQVRDERGNPSGSTAYFNPGTLVRITDGVRTAYQVVDQIGDADGGQADKLMHLAGSVSAGDPENGGGLVFEGGRTRIEALAPTPVNLNTAPREVLYAVLANLHLRTTEVTADNTVSPALAWTLAERLVEERAGNLRVDDQGVREGGPFRRVEDFGRWLENLEKSSVIKRAQRWALYRNAVNPHDSALAFGTTAWCFRTLDVYHVESRVAVHDRMGNQLATATQREVVEVGADRSASWTLDSQAQFEERLAMGSGAKWFASYPRGVVFVGRGAAAAIQPPLRAPKALLHRTYPSPDASEGGGGQDMGDVRLAPSRVRLPGAVVYEKHFDDTHWTDGWFTETRNAFTHDTKGTLVDSGEDPRPRPFSLSFWWRSMSDAAWTAFDCGMGKFLNRYGVFVDEGDEGLELVFRVSGGTLEDKGAECYVPLTRIGYQPGEWFHIHVSASGEDPSSMELLVDGVDVGKRRHLTYLTSNVNLDATDLPVETTAGFQLRGALQIGTEIVEYDLLSQDSFRECVRAARGTTAKEWPEGTPVRLLGYSMPLLQDVMAGGSYLPQSLLKMTAVRIDNCDDSETVMVDFGGQADVPVPIWGLNQDRTSFSATLMDGSSGFQPLWGQPINDAWGAFGLKGYALLGCPVPGNLATGGATGGAGGTGSMLAQRGFLPLPPGVSTASAPAEDPPAPPPNTPPSPGGAVPPGTRPPPTDPPAPPSGGGGSGGGGTGGGGTGGGGTTPGTGGGNYGVPVGGWEIVQYRRNGNTLQIDRFKSTPNHQAGQPYFLCTHYWAQDPQYPDHTVWPSFLIPISVQASAGGVPGSDYLDPSNPQDMAKLQRYGGDGDARWLLGTSTPEGWNECGRYSHLDRSYAAPGVLFVQERNLNDLTVAFFGQRSFTNDPAVTGGSGGGSGGGGSGGGTGGGGTGGGGTGGGSGGGSSGGGGLTPNEPAAPTPPSIDDGGGAGEGGDTPGSGEGDGGDGDGSGGGATGKAKEEGDDNPGDRQPSDEEPPPDSSGGGGSNDAEGDGPVVPEVPPKDLTYTDDAPPAPTADGSGLYFEPAYQRLRDWSRLYFRGTNGTVDLDHTTVGGGSKESLFMPCFRAWEESSGLPRRCGRNDIVTLTDGAREAPARYPALVRWADPTSNWTAFDEFIDGEVVRALEEGAQSLRLDHRGRPRLLKFPCGELPEELPKDMEFGRSTLSDSAVVTAYLDELFIWRHDQQPLAILANQNGILPDADEISVGPQAPVVSLDGTPGHDGDCGILSIGGELIIWRGTRTEGANTLVLERCVRGAMGTKARAHPQWATGRLLFDVPVSTLAGTLNRDANSIPLVHARNWPLEGCVRILKGDTAELVHYTALSGTDLLLPGALDADEGLRDRGLFRGRFGTQTLDHDREAVVLYQPFRRWDRYTGRRGEDERIFGGFHDHPDSGYLELSKRLRGALWQRLTWVEGFDLFDRGGDARGRGRRDGGADADTFMDVFVAVRLNPAVPWDTTRVIDMRSGVADTPGSQRGDPMQSVLVFSSMDGENRIEVESETADLRVYFVYKPDAWVPQDAPSASSGELTFANAWKRSPHLQEITLEYVNRTTTRGGRAVLAR